MCVLREPHRALGKNTLSAKRKKCVCLGNLTLLWVSLPYLISWWNLAFFYVPLLPWGWLVEAKVSCILQHRGIQLILAYSWARPVISAAVKGREEMFFISSVSSLSFIFLSPLSVPLFHLLCYLFSLFSLSLGDNKRPSRVDVSLNTNTNQKIPSPSPHPTQKEKKKDWCYWDKLFM